MINHNFFRDKRILVTGHTGFKGSWLIIWLIKMKANVLGYSLEPEDNSLFSMIKESNFACKNVFNDILNKEKKSLSIESYSELKDFLLSRV